VKSGKIFTALPDGGVSGYPSWTHADIRYGVVKWCVKYPILVPPF